MGFRPVYSLDHGHDVVFLAISRLFSRSSNVLTIEKVAEGYMKPSTRQSASESSVISMISLDWVPMTSVSENTEEARLKSTEWRQKTFPSAARSDISTPGGGSNTYWVGGAMGAVTGLSWQMWWLVLSYALSLHELPKITPSSNYINPDSAKPLPSS